MVHAALFISPSSSCETARIFVSNCIYISMSYHYRNYDFVGPESDLERYRFRSASARAYWCVSKEFYVGASCDFRRNIPWQLWYSNYGTSDPGGSRARGRARARAEQPTWAHRVRYRELGPIGMFRRKSLSAPRKNPPRHTHRLEELTDLKLNLPTPESC